MRARTWLIPTMIATLFGAGVVLAEAPVGKTREQVKAECAAAKKDGTMIKDGECSYDMPVKATSTKTREQVKAECAAAKRDGTMVRDGECSYDMPLKATSTASRADVKADCAAARAAGTMPKGECDYPLPVRK